ncbi:MAG: hypothetical protein AAGF15_00550 [Pseudomonadota bacterium]
MNISFGLKNLQELLKATDGDFRRLAIALQHIRRTRGIYRVKTKHVERALRELDMLERADKSASRRRRPDLAQSAAAAVPAE